MKERLERLISGVPMYALTGGSLVLLIIIGCVVAFFGGVAFTPTELLMSTSTFVLAGLVASYAFGRLYSSPSHLRSALITGSILALIFTPSLEPLTLLQYALISFVAQASKYVVTYKARHIFNPAAFGAFAGSLLMLPFASWWVGTPIMFLPLVFLSLVVLYKTRQLIVGAVFVGLALAVLIAVKGIDPQAALLSWPIIFMAGFMLSEPLTAPPRQWQRLMVAGVVALIVSLPFSIGWFYSSPEFALIAGNLVAFIVAFRQRAGIKLRLKSRRTLTPDVDEFTFETNRLARFEPGQYVEITLPHKKQDARGTRRMFSIVSAPGTRELAIAVKFPEKSSSYKRTLRSLEPGMITSTTGTWGDFVLPTDSSKKLLYIAGGIGITPFVSHTRSFGDQVRDIRLLYYVRSEADIAYRQEIERSGVRVEYITSVTDASSIDAIKRLVPDLVHRTAYVSGPPAMVASFAKVLKGSTRGGVHTDFFNGY